MAGAPATDSGGGPRPYDTHAGAAAEDLGRPERAGTLQLLESKSVPAVHGEVAESGYGGGPEKPGAVTGHWVQIPPSPPNLILTVVRQLVYDVISMKQTIHIGIRPQGAELNRATCVDP